MAVEARRLEEFERVADEQAALRRIATLVAAGATEMAIAAAVSAEIGGLFGAQRASVIRWDGDTIRVIGSWRSDEDVGPAGAGVGHGGGDPPPPRGAATGPPGPPPSPQAHT